MDPASSLALLVFLVVLWATHALRVRAGTQRSIERVEIEGASALLSRGMLESLYTVVVPVGQACTRLGFTPNAISGFSVLLAVIAAGLFAADHLGVGSVFAVAAMGCDALDGFVARASGSSSNAGEVIDAAADRYVELCLFAGLAVHLRWLSSGLLLALVALGGSFMVSYSTAKAEALAIVPPRGSMRRTERAFLLIVGAGLSPLVSVLELPPSLTDAPLLVALAWLAVGTHVSAISRLGHVARELRLRDGRRSLPTENISETLPVDQ
jgi:CDP-diacylglycerol--glycerol-3-phosphate 3-phosphatidyltransferase